MEKNIYILFQILKIYFNKKKKEWTHLIKVGERAWAEVEYVESRDHRRTVQLETAQQTFRLFVTRKANKHNK